MCDIVSQLIQKKEEEKKIEEAQAVNDRYWKIPACYDDDDDYTFAITPNEPDNSLSMGNEHLDTISATESDEFIKSSVENLVPIPSESEGESECDVPARKEFTTLLNVLFDAEYESDSSDDQSCSDEDIPEKIFSNPLFEEEIIPMKINQNHDNVESDLIESPRIDESDCDPEEDIVLSRNCCTITHLLIHRKNLFLQTLLLKLNLSFHLLSPLRIVTLSWKKLIYPLLRITQCLRALRTMTMTERDILIFEDLPSNDTLSIPKKESFHFDIPSFSRPHAKPPDDNTGILNVKMMGDISDQKVPMHKLMITLVPNQEKSPDILSHSGLKTFQPSDKCSMMIYRKNIPILDVIFFHFYPP
uniref:Uncharacterized protein n=1 Tax=Tanacetum cinerariifolium TaxID=118510 RepID=A0A6L2K0W3_TANCI|nr:hypothetical protein [Tanacetum cinerariifolium]